MYLIASYITTSRNNTYSERIALAYTLHRYDVSAKRSKNQNHPLHPETYQPDWFYAYATIFSRRTRPSASPTRWENKPTNLTMAYRGTYETNFHGCQTWIFWIGLPSSVSIP